MEVGGDDVAGDRSLGGVLTVTNAVLHVGQRFDPSAQSSPAPVVLKPRQRRNSRPSPCDDFGEHFTNCPALIGADRLNVEESESRRGRSVARDEVVAEDLVARTDCEDRGTPINGAVQSPVALQQVGSSCLGSIFSPTEEVEVGVGHLVSCQHLGDGYLEATPAGTTLEHLRVATIAVGAEEVGVEHRDANHPRTSATKAPNAV